MLCSPGESVICLPFTFESLTITGIRPEFRLFEEDFANASIDYGFDLRFLEILQIIQRRNNVRIHRAMHDGVVLHVHLYLVGMLLSIPHAIKITLISTPCDACHKMCGITFLAPTLHTFVQGLSCAIHHDGIRLYVNTPFPWLARLKGSFHFLRLSRKNASHHS